jgi:hypothetical protein
MCIRKDWNPTELLGYVSTWSAVRRAEQAGATEILHSFAADLSELWGDPMSTRPVSWPVVMRLGML